MAGRKKPGATSSEKSSLWMTEKKAFAFLAIKKTVDKMHQPFATGTEEYVQTVVERWSSGEPPKAETDQVEEPELPLETTQEATLNEALKKGVEFASSQAHLIAVTAVAPAIFEFVHVSNKIFDPVKANSAPVQDDDVVAVYALTQDQYESLEKARKNLLDLRLGVAALPNATLMSLVATFDALIVDLVAKMLRLNKIWMTKGDRKLGYEKVAEAESLDALITEAISEEIYQFSRGSHDEQAKYFETIFGVSIRFHWKRWPDYIKVFERRNLIAHGEATFNARYVSVCSSAGHKGSDKLLNKSVEIRSPYLRQALEILTEFAILLPFAVWRKVSDEEEEKAFTQLNEAAYNLIVSGLYTAAERVLEFALTLTKVKVPASIIQTLTINRASALRHAGHKDQADSVLDGVDWSASSDVFQICMYAVRGDAAQVARLLPKFAKSDELNAPTFKQRPYFSFVRDDDAVKQAYLETFGEPLSVPATQTPAADVPTPATPPDETPTVH